MIASSECWVWKGSLARGYGKKTMRVDGRYRTLLVHRLAFEWANGPIPAGMYVLHRCDNPPCCRPDHLFIGDQRCNLIDAVDKGRHFGARQTHCAHGHAFDTQNTYVLINKRGRSRRYCRACNRMAVAKYDARTRP